MTDTHPQSGGVPLAEATAHDFMVIRAALVRRLGSANNALVWARLHYRTSPGSMVAHEQGGHLWWKATREGLADETGLTTHQVRRALEALTSSGAIASTRHNLGGAYDQSLSYRPVIVHRANLPDQWAVVPTEEADSPDLHRANLPDVPLTRHQEEVPAAEPRERIDELFTQAWESWPKKVDRKDALQKFRLALRQFRGREQALVDAIKAHGEAYAAHNEPKYRPGLAVWLNKERWNNPLPGTPEAGGGTTAPGAATPRDPNAWMNPPRRTAAA